ncbi:MAG: hypothetical protein EP332_02740 [Bacteroidetes bacterium]|nr:MAG: hypothetical protein EP332_02740 [Bacteroidota bacterium]
MQHQRQPNGSEVYCQLLNTASLHLLPGSSYAESLAHETKKETYISGEASLHFLDLGHYLVYADEVQIELNQGAFHVMAYPECRHLVVESVSAKLKVHYQGNLIYLKAGQQLIIDRTLRIPMVRKQGDNCPSLNCLPLDICIAILSRKFDSKIELVPGIDHALMVIFNRGALKLKQALEPVCEQLNLKMSMHEASVRLSP